MNSIDIKTITSADVGAWVLDRAANSGIKDISLIVSNGYYGNPQFIASITGDSSNTLVNGETLEEAIEKLRDSLFAPAGLIAAKREQARKLLEEAATLERAHHE